MTCHVKSCIVAGRAARTLGPGGKTSLNKTHLNGERKKKEGTKRAGTGSALGWAGVLHGALEISGAEVNVRDLRVFGD